MKDYSREIYDWISSHQAEMIEDICTLVRINSEKTPEQENKPFGPGACAALERALLLAKSYGFNVKNYNNYVGCVDMNNKDRQLDMLAHLDVVPVEPQNWTVTQPFDPVVKDGCLYGRGSADDKGPAVASLYAMRAVKELGIPLSKNVRLILGTDEECGSLDIEYYYAREPEAPMTFSPDAEFPVINLEKGHFVGKVKGSFKGCAASGIRVVSAACGSKFNVIPGDCTVVLSGADDDDLKKAEAVKKKLGVEVCILCRNPFTVKISGRSGHAASPEGANNALTAALEYLSALDLADNDVTRSIRALSGIFPHGDYLAKGAGACMADKISGNLTLSLNMLNLDSNGFEAVFDVRYPMCGNRENVENAIRRTVAGCGFELDVVSWTQPHYVPEDTPFIKALLDSYETFKHKKGYCMAIGGGTYVHNLKNGVAFGPADLDVETRIHGNDENIPVKDLIMAAAIYAQAIVLLCR